jgi:hypothetical protein
MISIWYAIPQYAELLITHDLRVRSVKSNQEFTRYHGSATGRKKLDLLPVLSKTAKVTLRGDFSITHDLRVTNKYGDEVDVHIRYSGVTVNIHLLAEQAGLRPVAFNAELAQLQKQYPGVPFALAHKLPPVARQKLLCLRNPELISEWDDELEVLATLPYASDVKRWWRCSSHKLRYELSPASLTVRKRGCPECVHKAEHYTLACKNNISTAARDEEWMAITLGSHPAVSKCEAVGQESNPIDDVVVSLRGDEKDRSIQVKHLVAAKKNEEYTIHMKDYPRGMLVLAVNQERTRFFAAFAEDLPGDKTLTLTFTPRAQKFTDLLCFLDYVAGLLPRTVLTEDLLNRYTPEAEMERAMKARLQQSCSERAISYTPAPNNGTAIDMYLASHPVQLKAVGRRVYQKYVASVHRRANGTIRPYNQDGVFCIIPRQVLADNEYIAMDGCRGRDKLLLYPPGADLDDLFTPYWSAFHLLQ